MAPSADASVGVAMPAIIEPSTINIRQRGSPNVFINSTFEIERLPLSEIIFLFSKFL